VRHSNRSPRQKNRSLSLTARLRSAADAPHSPDRRVPLPGKFGTFHTGKSIAPADRRSGFALNTRDSVSQEILRYLLVHPDARDSAEGIRVWWLRPGCEATALEVEEALDDLIDRGWVRADGDGDVVLFGLNGQPGQDILKFIGQGKPRG